MSSIKLCQCLCVYTSGYLVEIFFGLLSILIFKYLFDFDFRLGVAEIDNVVWPLLRIIQLQSDPAVALPRCVPTFSRVSAVKKATQTVAHDYCVRFLPLI